LGSKASVAEQIEAAIRCIANESGAKAAPELEHPFAVDDGANCAGKGGAARIILDAGLGHSHGAHDCTGETAGTGTLKHGGESRKHNAGLRGVATLGGLCSLKREEEHPSTASDADARWANATPKSAHTAGGGNLTCGVKSGGGAACLQASLHNIQRL
jgi:hypothetical protein